MQTRLTNLLAHPNACSLHPQTIQTKLRRHIEATGLYPPLIVRSLTSSRKFTDHRHRLQILDGHLRFKVLQDLRHTHAQVVNFGPLTDRQAQLFLLTLNHLRSPGDPRKRAQLLKSYLADYHLTLADLGPLLPDSRITLKRLLDLTHPQPTPTDPKSLPAQPRPFAVYLSPDQHTLLNHTLSQIKKTAAAPTNAHALEHLVRTFLEPPHNDQPPS